MTSQSQLEPAVDGADAEGQVFESHRLESGISEKENTLNKFSYMINLKVSIETPLKTQT